jgi:peptidoglycan hydrolase FlgJ
MSGILGMMGATPQSAHGTIATRTTGTAGPAGAGTVGFGGAFEAQRNARLVDAAQQFEGMMLEQILKPMQSSQDSGFGQDPDGERDGSLDTMSSYGTEAVARAIARSGGVGIARKIVAEVSRTAAKAEEGRVGIKD